jgi:hypothetical protein
MMGAAMSAESKTRAGRGGSRRGTGGAGQGGGVAASNRRGREARMEEMQANPNATQNGRREWPVTERER